jgi:hypothetical protein
MSSWANRNLPRKRDLSQIPPEFRPEIVPRVAQPAVVLSETFRFKPENEVIYPDRSSFEPIPHPRQFVNQKIEPTPASRAKELRYQDKTYVFVILRHIRNTRDNDLWISCYNSIRQFYTNKIIIIDDNSSINTVNGKLINTEIIQSEFNGAGEILPYYYLLKNKWADRMIFLHDSMFMNRVFSDTELQGSIRFHWHFENKSENPKMSTFLSMLMHSDVIAEFIQHSEWRGCFGATSMVDLEVVEKLEETYGLLSRLILFIRTRSDREMFERVLGMVVSYEGLIQAENYSNFGDILKYPKYFETQIQTMDLARQSVVQHAYDTAIVKVWKGR